VAKKIVIPANVRVILELVQADVQDAQICTGIAKWDQEMYLNS
jgi:hypothetical protein